MQCSCIRLFQNSKNIPFDSIDHMWEKYLIFPFHKAWIRLRASSINKPEEACWEQSSKQQSLMKILIPQGHRRHPLLLLLTQCRQNNLLVTTATLTTGLQSIPAFNTYMRTSSLEWLNASTQIHTDGAPPVQPRPFISPYKCVHSLTSCRSTLGNRITAVSLFSWHQSANWFFSSQSNDCFHRRREWWVIHTRQKKNNHIWHVWKCSSGMQRCLLNKASQSCCFCIKGCFLGCSRFSCPNKSLGLKASSRLGLLFPVSYCAVDSRGSVISLNIPRIRMTSDLIMVRVLNVDGFKGEPIIDRHCRRCFSLLFFPHLRTWKVESNILSASEGFSLHFLHLRP